MPNDLIIGALDDETGYAIITVNLASGDSPESRRLDGKRAMIDTGATNSAIDEELIAELGLDQVCNKGSRAFDRVIEKVPYYAGRIVIPEFTWGWDLKCIAPTKRVPGHYDAIIGNDILGSCTLMVIGRPQNKFGLMHGQPGRGQGFSLIPG